MYKKYENGRIEKALYKGLSEHNEEDRLLKQEINEAIRAFKASKTAGYVKKKKNRDEEEILSGDEPDQTDNQNQRKEEETKEMR